LSKTSQDDCPAGPSFDRLPRIALSAAARNAGKPAIEGNNLSWRFGGTAQPLPASDQAADLVDGAGGVLVAAQIDELQIGREAKEVSQLPTRSRNGAAETTRRFASVISKAT